MSGVVDSIRSGLRTGEPKWVIPSLVFGVAATFVFLNGPIGESTSIRGSVTSCRAFVQRLTGAQVVACAVELDDGTRQSYDATIVLPSGTRVSFQRYARRLIGTLYVQGS